MNLPSKFTDIQSDAGLLLGPPKRVNRPYVYERSLNSKSGFGSDKFKKANEDDVDPIYKIVATSRNLRSPPITPSVPSSAPLLSDEENNNIEIQREIPLDLAEYDSALKIDYFNTIRFGPGKVVCGDADYIVESPHLKISFKTNLSSMKIMDGHEIVTDIDLLDMAKSLYFGDTKLFFILEKPVQIKNYHSSYFLIYVGQNYGKKLKGAWKQLKVVQNEPGRLYKEVNQQTLYRVLQNQELSKLAQIIGGSSDPNSSRPTSSAYFPSSGIPKSSIAATPSKVRESLLKGKDFKSLQKKPSKVSEIGRASRINTPKNTLSSPSTASKLNSPAQTPANKGADLKAFYSPIGSRVTRSTTKTTTTPDSAMILLDDPDNSLTRNGPRKKKEIFKPSLVYKFKDNSSYKIRNMDFQCLYRGQWINDTLIDFFLKYFAEEAIDKGSIAEESIHIFTTFFFTKLKSTPKYYENIERWVSKIDFSKKKYVIVPINENLHWYCSIIVGFDKILDMNDKESKCKIYVFDSLRQEHTSILKPLRTFLVKYAKDKFDIEVDQSRIELKPSSVPKQPNFNDCGIHVMYNVSKFVDDPQECLNIWDSEKEISRAALSNFFKKKEREDMREKLRKILKQLQGEQEHRVDDSDVETPDNAEEEDADDLVYIDAEEFHDLKNKNQKLKEGSSEGEQTPASGNDQKDDGTFTKDLKNNIGEVGEAFRDEDAQAKIAPQQEDENGSKQDKQGDDAQMENTQVDGSQKDGANPSAKDDLEENQERFFSSQEENSPKYTDSEKKTEDSEESKSQKYFSTNEELPDGEPFDKPEKENSKEKDFGSQSEYPEVKFSSDIVQIEPLSQNINSSNKEPHEEVPGTQESQVNDEVTKGEAPKKEAVRSSPINSPELKEGGELEVDKSAVKKKSPEAHDIKKDNSPVSSDTEEETQLESRDQANSKSSEPVYQGLEFKEPDVENNTEALENLEPESEEVHEGEEDKSQVHSVENSDRLEMEQDSKEDRQTEDKSQVVHIIEDDDEKQIKEDTVNDVKEEKPVLIDDESVTNTQKDDEDDAMVGVETFNVVESVDDAQDEINFPRNPSNYDTVRSEPETAEIKTPERQGKDSKAAFEGTVQSSPLSPVSSVSEGEFDLKVYDTERIIPRNSVRKIWKFKAKPEVMDLTGPERPNTRRSTRLQHRKASPSEENLVDIDQVESGTEKPDVKDREPKEEEEQDDDVVIETKPSSISRRKRDTGSKGSRSHQQNTERQVEEVRKEDVEVNEETAKPLKRPLGRQKDFKPKDSKPKISEVHEIDTDGGNDEVVEVPRGRGRPRSNNQESMKGNDIVIKDKPTSNPENKRKYRSRKH